MAELRLDPVAFDACITSGRHADRIVAESALARRLGATALRFSVVGPLGAATRPNPGRRR